MIKEGDHCDEDGHGDKIVAMAIVGMAIRQSGRLLDMDNAEAPGIWKHWVNWFNRTGEQVYPDETSHNSQITMLPSYQNICIKPPAREKRAGGLFCSQITMFSNRSASHLHQ